MRLREHVGVSWIRQPTLEAMAAEAEQKAPRETGGVLIGYWNDDRAEVVITHATGPGPAAIHRKARFVPDTPFHGEEIARLYRESGRTETYLGDWHSHPGGMPALSWRDRTTLAKIAQDGWARAPVPLMGILVGGPSWTFIVWRYQYRRFGFLLGPDVARLECRTY